MIITWAERVHEAHVRLGIVMANCDACRKADTRPEWVRRASERRLPVRVEGGATRPRGGH